MKNKNDLINRDILEEYKRNFVENKKLKKEIKQ